MNHLWGEGQGEGTSSTGNCRKVGRHSYTNVCVCVCLFGSACYLYDNNVVVLLTVSMYITVTWDVYGRVAVHDGRSE